MNYQNSCCPTRWSGSGVAVIHSETCEFAPLSNTIKAHCTVCDLPGIRGRRQTDESGGVGVEDLSGPPRAELVQATLDPVAVDDLEVLVEAQPDLGEGLLAGVLVQLALDGGLGTETVAQGVKDLLEGVLVPGNDPGVLQVLLDRVLLLQGDG